MLMRRGGEICAWSDVIAPREEDKHKHLWVSACEEEQISREENTNTALDGKEAFVCRFIWWVKTSLYRVNCHKHQHKNTHPTLCRQLEGPRATFLRGKRSNGHKHTHTICVSIAFIDGCTKTTLKLSHHSHCANTFKLISKRAFLALSHSSIPPAKTANMMKQHQMNPPPFPHWLSLAFSTGRMNKNIFMAGEDIAEPTTTWCNNNII